MMEGKKQENYFFLVEFISGGISAIISKSLFSPLEVIKLRLQCGNEMVKIGTIETPYLGITDCWRKILSEEGVKAMWKGNGTNILKHLSTLTLNFALHDQIKAIFAQNSPSGYWTQLFSFLASGAVAGMLSMALIYHLDYARVRLSNDKQNLAVGKEKQFNGLIDVYRKTLASDGVLGLYRGFWISCLGIIVYRSLYFGLFDIGKSLTPNTHNNVLISFLLGWSATLSAGLLSYPLDTIRRRMMMRSCHPSPYRGSIHCATQVWKTEGFIPLFKGASISILTSVLGGSILTLYDFIKSLSSPHF